MDIAEFKERHPSFINDPKVVNALSDAEYILSTFCIAQDKANVAHGYLTAHLLTVPEGVTAQALTKVKAGSVELAFSDNDVSEHLDWLGQTSYGNMFKLLIKPQPQYAGIGMVVV